MLEIHNLSIYLPTQNKTLVSDIKLSIQKGQIMGLIGQSGSGKSLSSQFILDIIPSNLLVDSQSSLYWNGKDITSIRAHHRGQDIAYIPQKPQQSLNPLLTIYSQFSEIIKYHNPVLSTIEIKQKIIELLREVQLSQDIEHVLKAYSFELSGGMCQRILIAMALATDPVFLIADEPTTALDVITQKEVVDLLCSLRSQRELTILFITHDIALISNIADHISVMQAGIIIESSSTTDLLQNPKHDYTRKLIEYTQYLNNIC